MDHAAEARELLTESAAYSPGSGQTTIDLVKLSAAQVHALLDVAAAIREQTTDIREALLSEGVRTVNVNG